MLGQGGICYCLNSLLFGMVRQMSKVPQHQNLQKVFRPQPHDGCSLRDLPVIEITIPIVVKKDWLN